MRNGRDAGADGTVDSRAVYTNDVRGRPLVRVDMDPDGVASYRQTWTYDDAGNVLTAGIDEGADDLVEEAGTFTRDADGHVLTSDIVFADDEGGGWRQWMDWAYDAEGRVVLAEIDRDADGFVDSRETTTWDDACPG